MFDIPQIISDVGTCKTIFYKGPVGVDEFCNDRVSQSNVCSFHFIFKTTNPNILLHKTREHVVYCDLWFLFRCLSGQPLGVTNRVERNLNQDYE